MSNKDFTYISTVKQNGAHWEIYTQRYDKYIDVWVKKEGFGIMDMVIGLEYTEDWRDIAAGCIIDFINSTEGDPRYE